jgi:hypothetical protein
MHLNLTLHHTAGILCPCKQGDRPDNRTMIAVPFGIAMVVVHYIIAAVAFYIVQWLHAKPQW